MTILDQIMASKSREVEVLKDVRPLRLLEQSPDFVRYTFSLKQSILDPAKTGIIAEFKRRSPSKGLINGEAMVAEVTSGYALAGASGLSVLTESVYFGGADEDLRSARFNDLPILRKDFIMDEYQVVEAKALGADVILLIAACLEPARVKMLAALAHSLGLEVLLELHDEEELDHMNVYTDIVGINNRNLRTFEVDMDKSIRMAEKIGKAAVRVAESGISEPEDVIRFREYGFEGFLIGERFMRENDPAAAFTDFVTCLKQLQ